MKRFAYTVGALDTQWKPEDEQTQLNKFGAMGWELVGVLARADPEGRLCVYYYLRREILEKKSIPAPTT